MGRETTLETAGNTGDKGLFTPFFNKAAEIFEDAKDWVNDKLNPQFNTAANDTKSVEPDAVVDLSLFVATTKEDVAIAYALEPHPQAIKIDTNLNSSYNTDHPNFSYDNVLAQQNLIALGFTDLGSYGEHKDGVDGIDGAKTSAELARYQEKFNLEITGNVNDETLAHMEQLKLTRGVEYEPPGAFETAVSEAKSFLRTAYETAHDFVMPEPKQRISPNVDSFNKAGNPPTPTPEQQKILDDMGSPLNKDKLLITSNHGDRILNGKPDWHKGLDFRTWDEERTNFKQPVYAAQNGTVISAKDDVTGYGKNIIIDHDGVFTRYSHLDKFVTADGTPLEIGQTIQKGQQIAISGNTGNGVPHLDFEISLNNPYSPKNRINPEPVLEANLGREIPYAPGVT